VAAVRARPLARRHRRKARSSWWKARRKNLKQSRRNPRRRRESHHREKVRLKKPVWSVGRSVSIHPVVAWMEWGRRMVGELGPKIFLLDSGFFHIIRLVEDGLTFDTDCRVLMFLIDGVYKGGYPVITRHFTSHSRPPRLHKRTVRNPRCFQVLGAAANSYMIGLGSFCSFGPEGSS